MFPLVIALNNNPCPTWPKCKTATRNEVNKRKKGNRNREKDKEKRKKKKKKEKKKRIRNREKEKEKERNYRCGDLSSWMAMLLPLR